MNFRMYAFVLFVIVVGIFSGCTPSPYAAKRINDVESKLSVLIMDKACRNTVAISKERSDWTEDSRLIVDVVMVNKKKEPYRVQVQTTFKDADGFEVQTTNWELILLSPSGFYSYKATAMNTKSERYNVRIRTAK